MGCYKRPPTSKNRLADTPLPRMLKMALEEPRLFYLVFWGEKSTPNMTGRPGCRTMEMIGGSSASYLARTPCVPLFCTSFNRDGNRRAFRLPGEGGDHFHCTVEPSPGHIRRRRKLECKITYDCFIGMDGAGGKEEIGMLIGFPPASKREKEKERD